MEGNKVEKQVVPSIAMDFLSLDNEYHLRPDDLQQLLMTEQAYRDASSDSSWHDRAHKHFQDILRDREFLITKVFKGNKESTILYPIAFERIFKDAMQRASVAGLHPLPTDITPTYVLDHLDDLIQTLKIHDGEQGTRFLQTLLRLHLSPKKIILKQQLSRAIFDMVVQQVKAAFYKSIVHPGEMVGIVAAQTIGENSTQLVLDSFHSSGTAAAVKATSGVPRFKELLSVSKNIKTPILTIYLKEDIGTVYDPTEDADGNVQDPQVQEAKERAMKVMHSLEITRLVDVLEKTEIYWKCIMHSKKYTNKNVKRTHPGFYVSSSIVRRCTVCNSPCWTFTFASREHIQA
jgi:DNA-directed RNA polymerase II subunit RPB1